VRFAILASVLSACVLIRPPTTEERPRWRITTNDLLDDDCLVAHALIRKSGKQGIGMALQLRSRMDCVFTTTSAALVFPDGSSVALAPPPPVELHGRSQLYAWLRLGFDNNAMWNEHRNTAVLTFAYTIGAKAGTWKIGVHQQ
jgi:hypothetical protein